MSSSVSAPGGSYSAPTALLVQTFSSATLEQRKYCDIMSFSKALVANAEAAAESDTTDFVEAR